MSSSAPPSLSPRVDRLQVERLCNTIRGKLQFMDYLVRVAAADVERYSSEPDLGTRHFLRQLVEMHSSNLAIEAENMRLVGELCNAIEASLAADGPDDSDEFSHGADQ